MIRAIVLYIFLAPLSLLADLFVWLTFPVWAFIAAAFSLRTLPWPLLWVHTHDDDIYGSKTTHEPVPATFLRRFRRASWWMLRNPGYGWNAYVLGFASADIVDQQTKRDEDKFDKANDEIGGAWRIDWMTLRSGARRFSFRRDIPIGGARYIKLWLGWHYQDQSGRRMLKFAFTPFKRSDD